MTDDQFQLPAVSAAEALADPGVRWIDARKAPARVTSGQTLAGSRWVDPLAVGPAEARALGPGPLTVFCAHGQEVSHFLCAVVLVHGGRARYVIGGFEALAAAGAPLEAIST
ncbi:MAG: hypothetical protein AAFV49_18280 [Pseudomonadota bacterium]